MTLVSRCLVALLVSVVATSAQAPWFCHDLECPRYEVTERHDDYEVRKYPTDKWVSTVVEGYQYGKALSKGFQKLFKYISGANADKETIHMTAPVRVLVHSSEGPFCKSNFTVSFFLPARHRDNPPKPTNEDVFIETSEAFTAYVAQYGGWNSEDKLVSNAAVLYKVLAGKGVSVLNSEYYTAGYDPPFRLLHRHNEVWLIGKEKGENALGKTISRAHDDVKNMVLADTRS